MEEIKKEKIEKSESITKIATALGKFQAEVEAIQKNTKAFNYMYAPLEVIQPVIKEPLTKNGLIYTQLPFGENGLITYLIHTESGEFFRSEYQMNPVKNDPQGRGSCLTYMKRYALTSILGLTIEGEDDDGSSASDKTNTKVVNKNNNDVPF